MKRIFRVISTSMLCAVIFSCDAESSSGSKKAIMMEIVNNPIGAAQQGFIDGLRKSQGDAVADGVLSNKHMETVKYQHCIQNIGINAEEFKDDFEDRKRMMEENVDFNDVKSIELVSRCPENAIAKCEDKFGVVVDYYYADSLQMLKIQQQDCTLDDIDLEDPDSPTAGFANELKETHGGNWTVLGKE